jgi:hypothetical protein
MSGKWHSSKPRRWKRQAYHRHGFRLLTNSHGSLAVWSLFSGFAHMVYGLLGLLLVTMLVIVSIPLLYVQAKWDQH